MPTPITWQTINAPDLTTAGQLTQNAGNSFTNAIATLNNLANVQHQYNIDNQNKQDLQNLNQARQQLLSLTPDLASYKQTNLADLLSNNPTLTPENTSKFMDMYTNRENTLMTLAKQQADLNKSDFDLSTAKADIPLDQSIKQAKLANLQATTAGTKADTQSKIQSLAQNKELFDTKLNTAKLDLNKAQVDFQDEQTKKQTTSKVNNLYNNLYNQFINGKISSEDFSKNLQNGLIGIKDSKGNSVIDPAKASALVEEGKSMIVKNTKLSDAQQIAFDQGSRQIDNEFNTKTELPTLENNITDKLDSIKKYENYKSNFSNYKLGVKDIASIKAKFGDNGDRALSYVNDDDGDSDLLSSTRDDLVNSMTMAEKQKAQNDPNYTPKSKKEIENTIDSHLPKDGRIPPEWKYIALMGTTTSDDGGWWNKAKGLLGLDTDYNLESYHNNLGKLVNFMASQGLQNDADRAYVTANKDKLSQLQSIKQQQKDRLKFSILGLKHNEYKIKAPSSN